MVLSPLLDEERLEGRLRETVRSWTGHDIEVLGGMDIALLPQPLLTVHRARLGDVETLGLQLTMDRVDLDVAVVPLLLGRLEIIEASLVRPELSLAGPSAAAVDRIAARLESGLAELPIDRIDVVGGRLRLPGEATVDDLQGHLERERATGGSRFRAAGNWTTSGGSRQARIDGELGSHLPGRPLPVQIELQLTAAGGEADRLSFRGRISPDQARLEIAGELGVFLATPMAPAQFDLDPTAIALLGLPWRLESQLALKLARDPAIAPAWSLGLAESTLDWHGQALGVELNVQHGVERWIDLRLTAEALQLPETTDATMALQRWLLSRVPTNLKGIVAFEAASVTWREHEFRRLAFELRLDATGMAEIVRASAMVPGPGDASFTGRLGPLGPNLDATLSGRLEAAVQEPSELAAVVTLSPAILARSRTLTVETDLEWRADGLTMQNMDLRLDGLRAVGGLAWRAATEGRLPQFAARGTVDRLVVDEVLAGHEVTLLPSLLFDLAATTDLALDLRAMRTSVGDARLGGLTVRIDSSGGTVAIDRVSLLDISGSAATISGGADALGRHFDLELSLDVASLPRLLRLVGQEVPAALALLGPINIRGQLAGDLERVSLDAEIAADLFDARADISLADWLRIPSGSISIDLQARNSVSLLRQVGGVAVTAPRLDGPISATLLLTLEQREIVRADLESTLGNVAFALTGSRARPGGEALDRVELHVEPVDAATLSVLYRLATPPLELVPGPPANWLGNWPAQPLDWRWLSARNLELRINVGLGDPELRPIEISGKLNDGLLTIPAFYWTNDDTTVEAVLAMYAGDDHKSAQLALDLAAVGLNADEVLQALRLAPSPVDGSLDIETRLTASGESIRGLIGSLGGEVDLVVTNGRLGSASRGGVMIDRLDGALVIERGVVGPKPSGLTFVGPDGIGTIDGYFDLPSWIVDLNLQLADHAGNPLVRQRFFGKPEQPDPLPPPHTTSPADPAPAADR
jgi:hypothetical protein